MEIMKEKLLSNIMPEPNTGCWLWMGCISSGYGMISIAGKKNKTHRVSYQLFKGIIPKGLLVRHTCDQSSCINPDHLILGTHEDNMQDMVKRGRTKKSQVNNGNHRGENNPKAVLTEQDVLRIVAMDHSGKTNREIRTELGISYSCVKGVLYGLNWTHVTGIKRK